jgi:glutaredoxin
VTYRDVHLDPEALKEMEAASKGRRIVPVIVEEGKVTVGYGGG